MTRVLVTGASGLLGANLVLTWAERHEVTAVSHRTRLAHPRLDSRQADLAGPDVPRRLFADVRPEVVVHCAAATDLDACERDPALAQRLNLDMAQAVAEAAAEVDARLIHVSTDGVFDGQAGPYSEDDVATPVNAYGRSKLAGEAAVLAVDPKASIVRTNFFGWNAKPKINLAEWFLDRLRSGEETPGFTDVFFSPLLVNDLAELLEILWSSVVSGRIHLPGKDCLSKFEFGRRLASVFELDGDKIVPGDSDRAGFRAPRPKRTCLDGEAARRALKRDLPSVDQGLDRFRNLAEGGYVDRLRSLVSG